MAKKPAITTVTSGYYGRQALNTNFENIRDQFDNTLSLDGSTPNSMNADFDLNGNDLLNGKDGEFTNSLTVKGVDILDALGGSVGPATVFKTTNRFTGDGTTVSYTLSKTPAARANTDVFINGVYQQKDTYTVSGTTLTFSEAPPAVGFEVVIYEAIDVGAVDASSVTTSDGQDVQAKFDQAHYSTRSAFVADVAAGKVWAEGDVVFADGFAYKKVNSSSVLPALPNWEPVGEVYIEHAGGGTSASAASNQNALDDLFAAYDEVNLRYGSYQFGAGYHITGDRKKLKGQRQGRTYLYFTGSTCYGLKFAPSVHDGSVYGTSGNLEGLTLVGPGVSHTDGIGLEVSMHNAFLCEDVSVQGFRNGCLVSGGQFYSFRDFEVFAPTGSSVASVTDTYLFAIMPFDGGVNGWKHTYNVNVTRYQFGGDTYKNVQDAIFLGCSDGTRFAQGYVAYARRANLAIKPSAPSSAGNITATSFTDSYLDGVETSTGVPYGVYFDTTAETGTTNYVLFGSGCFIGNNTTSAIYSRAGHLRGVHFDGANISGCGDRNIDIEGTTGSSGTRLSFNGCQIRTGEGCRIGNVRTLTLDGNTVSDSTTNAAIELTGTIGSLVMDGNTMIGNATDYTSSATISSAAWGNNIGNFGRGGDITPTITYATPGGTPTVTTATGKYQVIGNAVSFVIYLGGINIDTSTGIVTLRTNIPAAFNASLTVRQPLAVFIDSVLLNSSDKFVEARMVNGSTSITIGEMGGAGPDLFDPYDAVNIDGASIAISGTYFYQ